MKKRLYDIIVMSIISVFAIDMAAEKAFAGSQNKEYDEIDAMIAKSNKSMVTVGKSVQKAQAKQVQMETEIVENVEELHETVEEVSLKAETLEIAIQDAQDEIAIMEEVAEEVAYTVAISGLDTISAMPMDIKEMIKIKKELKIIDMQIEKALESDSSADVDYLILLKNMYLLNGVK